MAISDDDKRKIEALSLSEIRTKVQEVNQQVSDCSSSIKVCEIKNPALKSFYSQVEAFTLLKMKIDAISDSKERQKAKDKCNYDVKEKAYLKLSSNPTYAPLINEYKILVDAKLKAEELQTFVVNRAAYLERKRIKRNKMIKKLALIGAVVLAAGGVMYSLNKIEEKDSKKSAKTTQTVQTTQQTVPFGLSEEKLKAFSERISKYPPKTQQAMCDGIEYLQWVHNAQKATFHKQYHDKDLAEANMVRLEGQILDNDKIVWAELLKINQTYLVQAKDNPALEFDLSVVLSALPERYDIVKNQNKKAQQATQGR